MDRYIDSVELLAAVESNLQKLRDLYGVARIDENIQAILRPLIKTSLEHLRSVLEYSAQDIWSAYNSKKEKIYFPYGKTEALFRQNVKRNLPNLQDYKSLYKLVESLQPHIAGNDWLIELCQHTNFNKHDSLSKQIRTNSKESRVDIGSGAFAFNAGSVGTITFVNGFMNGVPVGHDKPLVLSGDMSTQDMRNRLGDSLPIKREFNWVEFRFSGTATDVLQLIEKSHSEISSYLERLRAELT